MKFKLKQWIKLSVVCSTVMLLAACSTTKKPSDQGDIDAANAAYQDSGNNALNDDDNAESSGLGKEAKFHHANHAYSKQLLAQRVYHFEFDSTVVQASDKPAIEANANWLVKHSGSKVILEGHTDPRGSREYNIGLGERRAKAVAHILTANGVSPSQIRIVSYGAQKLASPGRTEEAYQQDRRVVLVYLKR